MHLIFYLNYLDSLKSNSTRIAFLANDFDSAIVTTTPLINKKWKSKEDLLSNLNNNNRQKMTTSQFNNDSSLYVALYDYLSNLEKHLNMHKGDQVHILSFNKTNEW